jgi:hypothetical protein
VTQPIPGSGQLTREQRDLVARSLQFAPVESNTVMIKALRPDALSRYLRREMSAGVSGRQPPFNFRTVGGMVARQQDTTHLRGPEDFIAGFRLDFPGSPFTPNIPVIHAMEFLAVDPDKFVIPLGAPTLPYPGIGYPPNQADVRVAAWEMFDAARRSELDPGTYRMELNPWPYTGTGITANSEIGFPERWMRFGEVPESATIIEHDRRGVKVPVAIYRGAALGWESLR